MKCNDEGATHKLSFSILTIAGLFCIVVVSWDMNHVGRLFASDDLFWDHIGMQFY